MANFASFKTDIKRRLGWPVINIELDDTQFDLALNEAILFYQRNHFDGSEQIYMPIQVTQQIKDNRYIDIADPLVFGVKGIFDIVGSGSSNLLSVDFVMTADAAWQSFRSGNGLAGYYNMMSYRSLIQQTFTGKTPIRFNYNSGRVYLDMSSSKLNVGDWIVLDTTVAIDPDTNQRLWEDPWINEYATACVKKIWGQTIKKYSGVQLPGNVMLDGQTMYNEAVEEKKALEDSIISDWQLPCELMIG